jgi:hypothetical protein
MDNLSGQRPIETRYTRTRPHQSQRLQSLDFNDSCAPVIARATDPTQFVADEKSPYNFLAPGRRVRRREAAQHIACTSQKASGVGFSKQP